MEELSGVTAPAQMAKMLTFRTFGDATSNVVSLVSGLAALNLRILVADLQGGTSIVRTCLVRTYHSAMNVSHRVSRTKCSALVDIGRSRTWRLLDLHSGILQSASKVSTICRDSRDILRGENRSSVLIQFAAQAA